MRRPRYYRAADWPFEAAELAHAGLYAWHVDRAGAAQLSAALGHRVRAGLIYLGQTGATLWPSGKRRASTLAGRIGRNHLGGRVARSTLRRTLAACLLKTCSLKHIGANALAPLSERVLSGWMREHLSFSIFQTDDRNTLGCLERHVVAAADPPLNLNGCRESPVRKRLGQLREALGRRPIGARVRRAHRPSEAPSSPKGRITLHAEMEEILRQEVNRWMGSTELSRLIHGRRRYRRGDGTAVPATQVAARARKYAELFECRSRLRRLQIRLRRGPKQ